MKTTVYYRRYMRFRDPIDRSDMMRVCVIEDKAVVVAASYHSLSRNPVRVKALGECMKIDGPHFRIGLFLKKTKEWLFDSRSYTPFRRPIRFWTELELTNQIVNCVTLATFIFLMLISETYVFAASLSIMIRQNSGPN